MYHINQDQYTPFATRNNPKETVKGMYTKRITSFEIYLQMIFQ